jgi:dTDP-4-amino-4,6-dideoxygalactose transaminase
MLVTNSADLYEKVKTYRHKQQQAAPAKFLLKCWLTFLASFGVFNPQAYGLRYWYRYQRPGAPTAYQQVMQRANRLDRAAAMPAESNFDYTHFQARLGLAQLGKLASIIYKRRHLAQLYQCQLAELPGIFLPPLHPEAVYAYYTIRVPNCERPGLRERMARRGVAVDRTYEYALPYLNPYQAYARRDYPQAAQIANEVLNLPCYPGLTDQQAGYVAACLRDCLREINFA